jgi:hypothetical protein
VIDIQPEDAISQPSNSSRIYGERGHVSILLRHAFTHDLAPCLWPNGAANRQESAWVCDVML